ncbi:MAG: transglycosylase SLT domain-containing protein [Candidatus Krumholzibacteriia bacterium]
MLFTLVAGVLACCVGGCGEPVDSGTSRELQVSEPVPAVPHPLVERDLPAIASSGVVRMITRYNSTSYFIHKGGQAGFDYELFQRYAAQLGLAVQVVIPDPGEDAISLLNSGRGDVVCAGTTYDPQLDRWVAATRPANFVQKVVVLPAADPRPDELTALQGLTISVPESSPLRAELRRLRRRDGINLFVHAVSGPVEAEELVARVGRNDLQATVADDVLVRAVSSYLDGFRMGPALGEKRPVVWLVRSNSPELRASLNDYLLEHIRVTADGRERRSRTYGIIYDRYFQDASSIRGFQEDSDRPDKSGRLSPWDEIVRREAALAGLDWRLVTALMYQESRFMPEAVSSAGALGLMQVMPQFAGAQTDSLFDPAANVRAGVRLMRDTFKGFAYLDSLERLRFTLATYHAGIGHVTDARRLAMDLGRDPNLWEDSLERGLELLMRQRYYSQTRHGFYRGAETVAYVEQILDRYRTYMRLVEADPYAAPEPPPEEPATEPPPVATDIGGGATAGPPSPE